MTKDYKLTVADVFPELLTQEEKQKMVPSGKEFDWLTNEGQQILKDILKLTLSRTTDEHKKQFMALDKVRLTPENVQSVLLTPDEKLNIEQRFYDFCKELNRDLFQPFYAEYQKNMDEVYDRIAREAGFDCFEANEERTGVRNYTAHGDSAYRDAAKMMKKYNQLEDASELKSLINTHISLSEWRALFKERAGQVMLRQMLAISRERMQHTDVLGNPILDAQLWKERLSGLSKEERHALDKTITAPVTFMRNGEPHVVAIDYNLAPILQRLVDAGYSTGQSDSGTLSDHPGYRYVDDDPMGRYVKGDCINMMNTGSGAYLTFWKPEATMLFKIGDSLNTQEQIDDIRAIAIEKGWVVEDSEVFFQPSLVIRLPKTYDGTSSADILKEASGRTKDLYPGLYEQDFMGWLEKRRPIEQQVIDEHGGGIRYTDEMIMSRWQKLADALEQAQRQRVDREQEKTDSTLERISDVKVYLGGDGAFRIKCNIDGRQMLSERLGDMDLKSIDKGMDPRRIAAEYYRDALNKTDQLGQGRGR